ncbi:MAG: 2-phosphosulfolactate phosphatase, partial [Rubrobacter sp.]|nr:2-phosphosulfolactate phosphatase [Rubrobacter sp.]
SDIPRAATVAMSTTNGTRVVQAGRGAAAIYTGAFVNASTLAARLYNGFPESEVFVVGCGWEGRRSAEDESAAGAILHSLGKHGAELDHRALTVSERYLRRPLSHLRDCSAARRLLRLDQGDDLELCLAEDSIPAAPRLLDGAFREEPG